MQRNAEHDGGNERRAQRAEQPERVGGLDGAPDFRKGSIAQRKIHGSRDQREQKNGTQYAPAFLRLFCFGLRRFHGGSGALSVNGFCLIHLHELYHTKETDKKLYARLRANVKKI
ncbi:hypothetical protein SDC9_178794 [bioreactor metagenome]|uniref:Uncharacterized protein n=1 Tax=bioreactor metagenome TaxID=1076179 RepID=A0A645GY47_9ZZZZ